GHDPDGVHSPVHLHPPGHGHEHRGNDQPGPSPRQHRCFATRAAHTGAVCRGQASPRCRRLHTVGDMQPQRSGPFPYVPINRGNARLLPLTQPGEKRPVMPATFSRIENATGHRPKGWLSSGLQESWHTLDYLVEASATYVADWINDDQPYLMNIGGHRLCSIPYSGEINDLPQILRAGRSSDEFELMIRRQFDTLYREGAQSGRVMAICLHPFIIGVPHRIGALDAALAYILRHEGVWRATGS